jgi:diguanylate cyclase (GGDEF)-like protein/PAS domain S-box-containing protein
MAKREAVWRRAELQAVTDYAEDYISLFDRDFRHIFGNLKVAQALGCQPRELAGKTLSELGMSPEQAALWHSKLAEVVDSGRSVTFEFTARTDTRRVVMETLLAPVKDASDKVQAITSISRDVSGWKRDQALRNAQNQVMREIAAGAPLAQLLETIVRLAEQNAAGRQCMLLLATADGRSLRPGYTGTLPASLADAICSRPIGPDNAACGAAAFHRQPVLCPDIASDPVWETHRDIALTHGLRAAWSYPILAQDGALIGTFAMYHRKAREPYELERLVLHESALVAAVAIQHRRSLDALMEIEDRYRTLTENAANIVTVTDARGNVLYVSPACEAILGRSPDELLGHGAYEWVHPDDVLTTKRAFGQLRDEIGSQITVRYRYRHKDGSWRVLEAIGKSRLDRDGHYLAVVSARDVTEREQAADALRMSQDRLHRALAATGLGLWDWDVPSGSIYVDGRSADILGHPRDNLNAGVHRLIEIIHPDDAVRVARLIEAHLKGEGEFYEYDARILTQQRDWRWVRSRGQVTERDDAGLPLRVTGTVKDIDAEQRMQSHLESANTQIELLLKATDEGIVGLDAKGQCIFANPAAATMLGIPLGEILHRDLYRLVRHTRESGEAFTPENSPIYRCIRERTAFRGSDEFFWRTDGQNLPVEYSVSPLNELGNGGAVLVFRDVSEKRSLAQQLHYQALHDPLTGLNNRRGFEARLTQLLTSARLHGREHALCYVDLDHFKLVNDTCGHAAGDELLRQLPNVLQPLVRRNDAIARLGGDEFAILLEDCPLDQAAKVAHSVRDAIRDFRFVWQYRTFTIGASIGVVGITSESQGLVSVLGAADTACYVAKDQGPNSVHISYPHDLAIIRRRGEMRWVARLKAALEENQFRLHYQSIARLEQPDAPATHHELLLRLVDGKDDLILPGAFLQAAERYQLMRAIDHWVIEHAVRHLGAHVAPDARFREHRFGINLAGESLRDSQLLEYIRQTLERHAVPAEMLYFEITETSAISNLGAAIDFLRGLKEMGCQLALDDFGSGMSSFSYLKHLPVDYLKIDGGFIKDLVRSPVDRSIVQAVTSVAREMGIETVAEYVESREILDHLVPMGVTYGQGHAIARPQPLEHFMQQQNPFAASA